MRDLLLERCERSGQPLIGVYDSDVVSFVGEEGRVEHRDVSNQSPVNTVAQSFYPFQRPG